MPHRDEPVRRLVIGEPVLLGHGLLEGSDGLARLVLRAGDARFGDQRCDDQHILGRIQACRCIRGRRHGKLLQLSQHCLRILGPALFCERTGLRIQITSGQPGQLRIGHRRRQDLVPQTETVQGGILLRHIPVRPRHGQQQFVRHRIPKVFHRIERVRPAAFHRGRISEELVVVRHVHPVVIKGPCLAKVDPVRLGARPVGGGSVGIAPHALQDVRRHVHQVPRGRHHGSHTLGRSQRKLRMRGGFHRVDVVMVRPGMQRLALEHRLQRRLDLRRAGRRLAVQRPQLPGMGIHHRFGEQHLHVKIVRILACHFAHRIGVRGEHRAFVRRIRWLRGLVAL